MAYILNIETATNICSVSLAKDGKLVLLKETNEPNLHSSQLTVFIEQLFEESGVEIKKLGAVAVSKGPGSYTGLRIGVSVAKGICYALGIPLISISTLQAMAFGMEKQINEKDNNSWLCPMIDARRMEVYSAFYDMNNSLMRDISADIIEIDSYQDILKEHKVYFFGNGAEKCKTEIKNENTVFIDDDSCSSNNMIELSYKKFTKQQFEDTAYFEPFYLKDFVATTPKKNIFN